jgi:predicted amidohydrolase
VKKVKVAAIQMQSPMGKLKQNCDHAEEMIIRAASQGAKIIVTPECCLSGYSSNDIMFVWHDPSRHMEGPQFTLDVKVIAKTIPCDVTDRFAAISKKLGVYLVVGLIEAGDDGNFYNTNVLLDPKGQIALKYRKLHPWPLGEGAWASAGDLGVPVAQTEYGKLACGICYDIRHDVPEQVAKSGAEIFLYSAAWTDETEAEALDFVNVDLPAIARDNHFALVYSNRNVSKKEWWKGSGRSAIYACDGTILAGSDKELEEDIVIADIEI